MKTSAALKVAFAVAGIALAGYGRWRLGTTGRAQPDLAATGGPLQERVAQAVSAAAAELEPEATKAAAIPELRAASKMGADQKTFQDLVENEEWWAPVRGRFPISVVLGSQGVLAALGPAVGDVAGQEIVKAARTSGAASGVLATSDGRAFLSAAGRSLLPVGNLRGSSHAPGGR